MYVPFEITDRGKFSFLACEKASSGLNLFFPDIWSTLSSNFLIVLFCFSHWSRSFASSCEDKTTLRQFGDTRVIFSFRPGLLETWLVLTSVKYHGNLYILIPLNQRLALTRLRATGPWQCSVYPMFCHFVYISSIPLFLSISFLIISTHI